MCLTNSQSADGVAVQIHLCDLSGMGAPDIRINAALIDTKEHLLGVECPLSGIQLIHLHLTALQPACGSVHGLFDIGLLRYRRRTLIKSHRDRRSQI